MYVHSLDETINLECMGKQTCICIFQFDHGLVIQSTDWNPSVHNAFLRNTGPIKPVAWEGSH